MDGQEREAALLEKREIWRQHIEIWQSSGVSQREYCRQHDLKYSRFVYWKQKYSPTEESAVSSAIVELPIFSQATGLVGSGLRVAVGSGYRIEVDRDFDPVAFVQLIDALNRL